TQGDGVTALNAATGAVLWHSPGPQDRMLLSEELLLAVQCGESDFSKAHGSWLYARHVQTGDVSFKVPLDRNGDPNSLRVLNGKFLVEEDGPAFEVKTLV